VVLRAVLVRDALAGEQAAAVLARGSRIAVPVGLAGRAAVVLARFLVGTVRRRLAIPLGLHAGTALALLSSRAVLICSALSTLPIHAKLTGFAVLVIVALRIVRLAGGEDHEATQQARENQFPGHGAS
jgi:hypothetical protein